MFKNAFNCKRCPQRNDEHGCPMWWQIIERDDRGNERINQVCGYVYLPKFLTEVIAASNRPAAAVESTRNEIASGLARVARAMQVLPIALPNPKRSSEVEQR